MARREKKTKKTLFSFGRRRFSFGMASPETAGSAAMLAKVRKRGPSVGAQAPSSRGGSGDGVGRSKRAKVVRGGCERRRSAARGERQQEPEDGLRAGACRARRVSERRWRCSRAPGYACGQALSQGGSLAEAVARETAVVYTLNFGDLAVKFRRYA